MSQDKLEKKPLVYFQNLVPGSQQSSFIKRYEQEVLHDEAPNSERKQLLNHFPPVLSFFEQQRKKFYDDEAKNCSQFCCGAMSYNNSLLGPSELKAINHYMLSTGSGALYEGSSSAIKTQMQKDITQAPFGSEKQGQLITGFNQFTAAVAQHEDAKEQERTISQNSALNPFQTKPKPPTE